MRGHPALRTVTILGLAMAGLVGGHALGYALFAPDLQHRSAVLLASGHSYLPSASWLALVAGVAAFVTGIASGRVGRTSDTPNLRRVMIQLASLQCAGFVALEVIERVVSSSPIHTLSPGLLVIGLLSQVVCAIVLALLVVGLRKVGAVLSGVAPVVLNEARHETLVVNATRPRSRETNSRRVRGPPLLRTV